MSHIVIIGAGAWGTALAIAVAQPGRDVTLWSRQAAVVEYANEHRRHPTHFPDVRLPDEVTLTSETPLVFSAPTPDAVLIAVPSQSLTSVITTLALPDRLPKHIPIVLCAKGILLPDCQLLTEALAALMPHHPIAILSGPNFASEVAHHAPSATVIACADHAIGTQLLALLGSTHFRPYYTSDMVGVQIAGAVKNVLAIACGIIRGLGYGENARAALLTRGLAEANRLSIKLGGRSETMMGLAGIGDAMLTCMSTASRNTAFGMMIGAQVGAQIGVTTLPPITVTTEGVLTTKAVIALAERYSVEMPIARAVHAVLYEQASVVEQIAALLCRPFTAE